MTREEKIKLAIEKGFTYDEVTGKIYSRFGREIKGKKNGYIDINIIHNKKRFHLLGHQFTYYYKYGKIVDYIDHINGIRDDNRISNMRSVTSQENNQNRNTVKGYHWCNQKNKYISKITPKDKKTIYLGCFDNEEEARQAYLDAKKIYHII